MCTVEARYNFWVISGKQWRRPCCCSPSSGLPTCYLYGPRLTTRPWWRLTSLSTHFSSPFRFDFVVWLVPITPELFQPLLGHKAEKLLLPFLEHISWPKNVFRLVQVLFTCCHSESVNIQFVIREKIHYYHMRNDSNYHV